MASSNARPETLRMKFQAFSFFDPRVSRVLLISIEILVLGFLQLIEGALQLTNVLSSFKGLLLAVISPTKPKSASLAYSLGFLAQLTKGCE